MRLIYFLRFGCTNQNAVKKKIYPRSELNVATLTLAQNEGLNKEMQRLEQKNIGLEQRVVSLECRVQTLTDSIELLVVRQIATAIYSKAARITLDSARGDPLRAYTQPLSKSATAKKGTPDEQKRAADVKDVILKAGYPSVGDFERDLKLFKSSANSFAHPAGRSESDILNAIQAAPGLTLHMRQAATKALGVLKGLDSLLTATLPANNDAGLLDIPM